MDPIVITVLLAFGVIIVACTLLGIGFLITGKARIIRGACGMDPNKARDERCGREISCEICKKTEEKKEKEPEDE